MGAQVARGADAAGRESEYLRRELAVEIVDRLHRQLGLRPGRVYLVKPRAIPRTHNGKLRRERRALHELMRQDTPKEAAVIAQIETIGALKTELKNGDMRIA